MFKDKGFVEDPDFKHWSDIPAGLHETKNFAYCPICKIPMNLIRGMSPAEVHLAIKDKVDAYIGPMTEEP
jgi:hypothetical protein